MPEQGSGGQKAKSERESKRAGRRGRGLLARCHDVDEDDLAFADMLAGSFPDITHVSAEAPRPLPSPRSNAVTEPALHHRRITHMRDDLATDLAISTAARAPLPRPPPHSVDEEPSEAQALGDELTAAVGADAAPVISRALVARGTAVTAPSSPEVIDLPYESDGEDAVRVVVGSPGPREPAEGERVYETYVVNVGDSGAVPPQLPGVYSGKWGYPDFIGLQCERKTPPPGVPAAKRARNMDPVLDALEWCRAFGTPAVHRGPQPLRGHPLVQIGEPLPGASAEDVAGRPAAAAPAPPDQIPQINGHDDAVDLSWHAVLRRGRRVRFAGASIVPGSAVGILPPPGADGAVRWWFALPARVALRVSLMMLGSWAVPRACPTAAVEQVRQAPEGEAR